MGQVSCPKGKIYRKSYKKSNKVSVKGNCINATSWSGAKTSLTNKRLIKKKDKIHQKARQIFGTPKCSSKQIVREGYERNGKFVKPICVASRTGKKSKQLFVLQSNDLKPYGYQKVQTKSKKQRHTSLKKAVEQSNPLSISRKLNALSILNKNSNPKLSGIFKSDSEWIKKLK